jgi:hypothetical protein
MTKIMRTLGIGRCSLLGELVHVRESSRFGFCYALGELIGETPTQYIYRNRAVTAFVCKSPTIHLAPCKVCADLPAERDEAA